MTAGLAPTFESDSDDSDAAETELFSNNVPVRRTTIDNHTFVVDSFRRIGYAVAPCGHSPHCVNMPFTRHRLFYHLLNETQYCEEHNIDEKTLVGHRSSPLDYLTVT